MSESTVNDVGYRLYQQALADARQERREQQQRHRKPQLLRATVPSSKAKKSRLTDAQIDHLFDEKRHREALIREDLLALYHRCSARIRSMLDPNEIDRFISDIQSRSSTNCQR